MKFIYDESSQSFCRARGESCIVCGAIFGKDVHQVVTNKNSSRHPKRYCVKCALEKNIISRVDLEVFM